MFHVHNSKKEKGWFPAGARRFSAEQLIDTDTEEWMNFQKTISASAVVGLALLACSFAFAGEIQGPIVNHAVSHTISRPLRELARVARPELSLTMAPSTSALLNFAGMSAAKNVLYSDANGAVGATQYVQLVNNQYTVYDKTTGAVIAGPVNANTLWATSGDVCATSNTSNDGTVLYDQLANVWVLQRHATPSGGPYLNCIALSTSSDATGTYQIYDFALTMMFPDKPRIALWPDAYYISQDVLDPTTKVFQRSQVCALQRDAMLAGVGNGNVNSVCFQGSISLPTFVVTTLEGQTLPPSGEVEFVWQLDQRPNQGKNNLNSFQFHIDWTNGGNNSTFTGPVANVLPAYTDACNNFKPCVPEPGTTNLLQGWGDRLTGRVVYRNFGTYESVVMTHAITRTTTAGSRAAIRWYEYRTPLTPVIFQSGVISPDTTWRWLGAINEDQFGDIAVGYNVSSTTVSPGLRYSGHAFSDKAGVMEPEVTLVSGAGSQNGTNKNWSSFQGMALDPVDDCTFWFTGQYYTTSSQSGWTTRVGSFRFPSCTN